MTSKDIYTKTIPYFYIIQHKETRILYAGAKWAKCGVMHSSQSKLFREKVAKTNLNKFLKRFDVDSIDGMRQQILDLVNDHKLTKPNGKVNFRKLAIFFPSYGDTKQCACALSKFFKKYKINY
ncbi:hypothetical protein UFOVP84_179 [uncultured Caudovirales phage]|uniref:Uncharacterized protein n=1 Tax=uncultured Caudovirales phage TaxID=2100421 RepID=A0A6J5L1C9_9CAUD|nr:hypothetical protein UFOVP84_179 [uncultured Caudovirales phage]